jgi:Domain of Unknown Function (DUF1206)
VPGPLLRLRRLVRDGRSDAPGPAVDLLGRVGLVSYGVVHLLVAWLALMAAFGVPDAAADARGAVATIAATGFGSVVLVLVTAGLVAFALWQITAAGLGLTGASGGDRFRKRMGAAAKAAACTALATITAGFVDGRGEPSGGPETRTLTARVLALPGGPVLVGLGAAAVLGVAVAMVYTGVRRTFMDDLDVHRLAPPARRGIEVLGVVGHLARALALGLVGVGIATAAVSGDVREAGGLDVALRGLGSTDAGSWLLVLVAVGFAAYGLFCAADAATRRT